jgi:hypothetical protein
MPGKFYTRSQFLGGIGRFRSVSASNPKSDVPSVAASNGMQSILTLTSQKPAIKLFALPIYSVAP